MATPELGDQFPALVTQYKKSNKDFEKGKALVDFIAKNKMN